MPIGSSHAEFESVWTGFDAVLSVVRQYVYLSGWAYVVMLGLALGVGLLMWRVVKGSVS